jgi:hypothetical protein
LLTAAALKGWTAASCICELTLSTHFGRSILSQFKVSFQG